MKTAALTDRGLVRQTNEDAYLITDNAAAVADGMGGHEAGELASAAAVGVLADTLNALSGRPKAALAKAFSLANNTIRQKARQNDRTGTGTTLTAVVIKNRRAWIGHVGDSRAYLLRKGTLKQLTEDHSLVSDLVKSGSLTPDEAKLHPRRHVITRAVGSQTTIKPDILSVDLHDGDRLILCTDGLTNQVSPEKLADLGAEAELAKACSQLVAAAKSSGGNDNITVVIVEISAKRLAPGRRRLLPTIFMLAVAVLLVYMLINNRLQNTFYLQVAQNRVIVRRGLPGNFAGFRLGRFDRSTDIDIDRLPGYYRRRIEQGLVVGNRSGLTNTLSELRKMAEKNSP